VGVTARGRTVSSSTIDNDGSEVASRSSSFGIAPGTVTYANMGTGPTAMQINGTRFSFVAGSGSPTAAGQITIPHRLGKIPSKVWIEGRRTPNGAVGFYVDSIDATSIIIGCKNAPVASSGYSFDLIVE
jgi:hypothetical protein